MIRRLAAWIRKGYPTTAPERGHSYLIGALRSRRRGPLSPPRLPDAARTLNSRYMEVFGR